MIQSVPQKASIPEIGARLRKLRRQHRLTQQQFAEQLAISASYLNLLENNKRRPTLSILFKLSQLFAVNYHEWLVDNDYSLYQQTLHILSNNIFEDLDITNLDVRDFVAQSPNIAKAVNRLYMQQNDTHNVNNDNNININDYLVDFLTAQKKLFS